MILLYGVLHVPLHNTPYKSTTPVYYIYHAVLYVFIGYYWLEFSLILQVISYRVLVESLWKIPQHKCVCKHSVLYILLIFITLL